MSSQPAPAVTELLHAMKNGDAEASEMLLGIVYDELRRIARNQVRAGHAERQTLQATALVNEAYLRLLGGDQPSWENRRHFFFAAARAMRDVLVEEARRKATRKRGGGWLRVDLERLELALDTPSYELLAVDEAIRALEAEDERKAEIVRLRFFAGLSESETAAALGVSVRTVSREWRYVRAWLYARLSTGEDAS